MFLPSLSGAPRDQAARTRKLKCRPLAVEVLEERCVLSANSFPNPLADPALIQLLNSNTASVGENPALIPQPGFGINFSHFMDRHSANLAAGSANATVLFLGDSITEQWNGGAAYGTAVWNASLAPLGAVNFGIAGDQTSQILWQIQHGELNGLSPRVVVLMIGTNNVSAGQNAAQVAQGIAAIVQQIEIHLPQSQILLLGILPRGESTNPMRPVIREINGLIARLDDGGPVHLLDMSAGFLRPDGSFISGVTADKLHLLPPGYQIWSAAMTPALPALLASGAADSRLPDAAPTTVAKAQTVVVPPAPIIPTPIAPVPAPLVTTGPLHPVASPGKPTLAALLFVHDPALATANVALNPSPTQSGSAAVPAPATQTFQPAVRVALDRYFSGTAADDNRLLSPSSDSTSTDDASVLFGSEDNADTEEASYGSEES